MQRRRELNDQGTREEENGTPIDSVVTGATSSLAFKDGELDVRDLRGILNVRKQLESEEIREVRVTWVESNPDPSASKT
jgi:hypothetical protein